MRLRIPIAVFGILSVVLYSLHWLFKYMQWPMRSELKLAAFGMGALGILLMAIDYFVLAKRETQENQDEEEED